jgi:preprotein translocase subunit SecG
MQSIILILHVLAALCIIALVLVQHGKGADAGAAFGSGSANTMFGSQGPMPFLMKLTALFAFIFFVTSITLSYLSTHVKTQQMFLNQRSVAASQAQQEQQTSSVVLNIPAKEQSQSTNNQQQSTTSSQQQSSTSSQQQSSTSSSN